MRDVRVEICRKAIESGRDDLRPDLAKLLLEQGQALTQKGSRIVGLEAMAEAAGLYRQLANADPNQFLPLLGKALTEFSASLTVAGRTQEALAAAEEAVAVYRRMT